MATLMSTIDEALFSLDGTEQRLRCEDPDIVNIPVEFENFKQDFKQVPLGPDFGRATNYAIGILGQLSGMAQKRKEWETALSIKREKIVCEEQALNMASLEYDLAKLSHDIGQDCSTLANYLFKLNKPDKTAFLYSFVASMDAYFEMRRTSFNKPLEYSILKNAEFVAYRLNSKGVNGFSEADLEFIVKGNKNIFSKRAAQIRRVDDATVHNMWEELKSLQIKRYGRE